MILSLNFQKTGFFVWIAFPVCILFGNFSLAFVVAPSPRCFQESTIIIPVSKECQQSLPPKSTTSSNITPLWVANTNPEFEPEETVQPTTTSKASFPSTTTQPAHSLHGRLLCAAQCAYYEPKEWKNNPYFMGAGFRKGTTVRRLAPRSGLDACLVGTTHDGIVVAFRGTSGNALEWLQNASIFLRKVPNSYAPKGCRVHEGFYGALRNTLEAGVKAAIQELVQDIDFNEEPAKIYVTGHSKGGSLASLFAVMLHQDAKLPSAELVCSFGAARVGNPAFCEYFNAHIRQVTYENDLDIIPFLPPGETTMKDMQEAMEDPEAMMDMIEGILGPELTVEPQPTPRKPFWRRILRRAGKRRFWNYNPIGKRTYIDPSGTLVHPVSHDLDVQRLLDLEGKDFWQLRRAHCSSCSDDENDGDNDDNDDDDNDDNDDDDDDVYKIDDYDDTDSNETDTVANKNDNDMVANEASTCSGGYFAALAPEICESMLS